MSDSLVPKICGKNDIYVPDDGCSECMRELNLFKTEVHQNYYPKDKVYTKEETDALLDDRQDTLVAGEGITISGNTISATGGGGSMTKAEILAALGYEEVTLEMKATDGTTVTKTILAEA